MSSNYNALPNGTGRDVFIVRDSLRVHGKTYRGPPTELETILLKNAFWEKHERRAAAEAEAAATVESGRTIGEDVSGDDVSAALTRQYEQFNPISDQQQQQHHHHQDEEQFLSTKQWDAKQSERARKAQEDEKFKYNTLMLDSMKARTKIRDMFQTNTQSMNGDSGTTSGKARPFRYVFDIENKEDTLDVVQSHHIPGYMGHVPRAPHY